MRPEDRAKFPATEASLRDGRSLTLRFLSVEDGERLGRFYEELPLEAQRFYWPHELDYEHGLVRAGRADDPFDVCLVAETPAAEIGGYAWYRWKGEGAEDAGGTEDAEGAEASTFGIAIAKKWQSAGLGRVLMTKLLEVAETVGPPKMQLTCQHANVRAAELYQKLGFRITREGMCDARRSFPAEPQYWMERECR